MNNVARNAIAQSIDTNEIVTIDFNQVAYDSQIHTALLVACDDSADNADITEYWGTDDDGHEWRVHVREAAPQEIQPHGLTGDALLRAKADYDVYS